MVQLGRHMLKPLRAGKVEHLTSAFQIRFCGASDLAEVLQIERQAYPHPWTEKQFQQELDAAYSRVALLQSQGRTVGYICYWLAAGELHILNVATDPQCRRQGVARALLTFALDQAEKASAEIACLEVRVGNLGAIALYREFGFTDDCIRRGYYSDGEDALLMSRPLRPSLNDGD